MLNFQVPPKVRKQRLETCLSCKYYKESTGSCGTLIMGNKLTDEQNTELDQENIITWYKRKTRLCGCVVKEKVKWKFERCPVNKWTRFNLNEEEVAELRTFMASLPKEGRVASHQVRQLTQWVLKLTGQYICVPCKLSSIIEAINNQLNYE